MKAKKYFYHMFPPFIDAYEQSFKEPLTLVEIKKMMKLNASYWIDDSIKTKGLDNHPIAGENYKQVIYCARIYESPNKITKKNKLDFVFKSGLDVVLLSEVEKVGNTFFEKDETLEFLEGETLIEKSWDVT
jgi:hypothetical protein